MSIDPAFAAHEKADWSVIEVWLTKREVCYLLDIVRVREEYPKLVRRIDGLIERLRPNQVIVEGIGGGLPLFQELHSNHGLIVGRFSKLEDKVVRMETEALAIEQGHVYIPAAHEWLETFRDEVVSFPMGQHDDQIDSMSQFLRWRRLNLRRIQHGPFRY